MAAYKNSWAQGWTAKASKEPNKGLIRLSARERRRRKRTKWLRSRPFLQLKRKMESGSGDADAPTNSRLPTG